MNKNKPKTNRIKTGFTIAELLVVVAIMTVVLSAVSTGVTSAMKQYRSAMRRSQVDILYSTLYEAVTAELRSATSIKLKQDGSYELESFHSEIFNTSGNISNEMTDADGNTEEGILCVGTQPLIAKSAYQDGVKAYIDPIIYNDTEKVFEVKLELKMDVGEDEDEYVKSHTFKVHPLNPVN